MNPTLKALVKRSLPRAVLRRVVAMRYTGNARHSLVTAWQRARKARAAFAQAPNNPAWLASDRLVELQASAPPLPRYGYDPESLQLRGQERAQSILDLPLARPTNVVEIGCMDGMTSCALQRRGLTATAIDRKRSGVHDGIAVAFDERAIRGGVRFVQTDAECLGLRDERFDLAFSYNMLEHVEDPDVVLREIIRVVRPGGYIFLTFGPLYMSPWGLHAGRSIRVPYCQFLFPRNVLQEFTTAESLEPVDFELVNGWTVAAFRDLWSRHADSLETVMYLEEIQADHVDLVERYPECFRSKTDQFDELIISSITALFRRR